jgi:hypothetical protein
MNTAVPKKPRQPNKQQVLIGKFVGPARRADKGFWPREMKMASKLVAEYNIEFLMWVIPPYGKPVPSLAYFMADYGKQYLMEQFFNFKKNTLTMPEKPAIVLDTDKIGEDAVLSPQKPKSLKDFLNLYATKS